MPTTTARARLCAAISGVIACLIRNLHGDLLDALCEKRLYRCLPIKRRLLERTMRSAGNPDLEVLAFVCCGGWFHRLAPYANYQTPRKNNRRMKCFFL
jgi:hypothetical protein